MSVTALSAPTVSQAPIVPLLQANSAAAASQADGNKDGQPAVVVNLSSSALASVQASKPLPVLDAGQVAQALSEVSGANGFAEIYAHADWASIQAQFGSAVADRDKAAAFEAVTISAGIATTGAANAGFSIQKSASDSSSGATASPSFFTVNAFSFTDGGSTYVVTPGKNGALVGTKDGQAWLNLQLTYPDQTTSADADAAAALKTLTIVSNRYVSADAGATAINLSV